MTGPVADQPKASGGESSARRHVPTRLKVFAVLVAAAVVASILCMGVTRLSQPGCAKQTVRVAVAPEIVDAVEDGARRWAALRQASCVSSLAVSPADPAEIATAIAAQQRRPVHGLAPTANLPQVPDIWVPDSSVWPLRLQAAGVRIEPAAVPSLARSSVVLVAPASVAQTLGASTRSVWAGVLQHLRQPATVHVGVTPPGRDAASLLWLTALRNAVGVVSTDSRESVVAAMLTVAANQTATRDTLLDQLSSAGTRPTLTDLSGAVLPEHAALAHNTASGRVPLVAVPLDPPPLALDYPFLLLSDREEVRAIAAELLPRLTDATFRDRLVAARLRGSDGIGGAGFISLPGVDPGPPGCTCLHATEVTATLTVWFDVVRPGKILAAIDVSGSMLRPLGPGQRRTRAQVVVSAAKKALVRLPDDWAAGLWRFSTNLSASGDYQKLVDPAPLTSSQRSSLLAALQELRFEPNGDTGLYDTILAAYQAAQAGYDDTRSNILVILTDGENDDPSGLSLDELRTQLQAAVNTQRPITVMLLGIGEANRQELSKIAHTVGGSAYMVNDPAEIDDIFTKAIAQRFGT